MKGMMALKPGESVVLYLPRRSTIQAFCCGTILMVNLAAMTATTSAMMAISMMAFLAGG